MTTKKDFYELLEIERTANGEEIKKSYRRLAMQYHPDRNPGNPEAEHKFKEISLAYEVLKDEQKRSAYDRYGHDAFNQNGFGGGNPFGFSGSPFGDMNDMFSDIFAEFFGGGQQKRGGNRRSSAQRGQDLQYNLEISLEEAFFGAEKEIKIPTKVVCPDCNGFGTRDGHEAPLCPHCGGSGRVASRQGGFFMIETTCPKCNGSGRLVVDKCKTCSGNGTLKKEKILKIKVPEGVENQTQMRLSGEGETGLRGGANGDLYIIIFVKEHKLYIREGANLYVKIPVSMSCAALGGIINIPSIDGKLIELKIPSGCQNEDTQRIKSEGMSIYQSSRRGDLFAQIRVEIPVNLSSRQKELLEEFASISQDNCHPESKGFFDKIKDLFSIAS